MPWFPDFVNAAELARKQTRAAVQADPVGQYIAALDRGETGPLEQAGRTTSRSTTPAPAR